MYKAGATQPPTPATMHTQLTEPLHTLHTYRADEVFSGFIKEAGDCCGLSVFTVARLADLFCVQTWGEGSMPWFTHTDKHQPLRGSHLWS